VSAVTLDTPLQSFPGVGSARAKALEKLGLRTAGDLLGWYPRAYEDRSRICPIAQAPEGEACCIVAMVGQTPQTAYLRKGLSVTKCPVVDATGRLEVTFFNQDYVRQALQRGESYVFYGRVERFGSRRQMTNPAFEPEGRGRFTGRIVPIYPLTAGISNNLMAGLALRCVEGCTERIPDELPVQVRQDHALAEADYAVRNIHFPADAEALELAKRRLAFEELFTLCCGMAFLRHRRGDAPGRRFPRQGLEGFLRLLPFSPTGAQRRAMEAVEADLTSGRAMDRLIQGDVGSGKTVVAACAAWLCHAGGAQTAMMAPTEILARQHYDTLSKLLAPAGVRVGLLVGSLKPGEKKAVQAALKAGQIDLAVGTHALLSAGAEYADLALVITDEQHRFGVGQRSALSAKAQTPPHVLVMSATPIPRTLALLIYGDLEVTAIDELPPGREPVQTFLVGEDKRQRMYGFVRRQVGEGRQVYIICPAVEEGDLKEDAAGDWNAAGAWQAAPARNLKAVKAYAKELSEKVFPDLRVGFVYGKLKAGEKEETMAAFARGELDVLVSTTVVEVGVDVPNAALMIIEDADRFGLSQLHQLRGRVGRGKWQSYCVLVSSNRAPETLERLRYFCSTTDGFQIAEKDLELRGPGDLFGARQHGLPELKTAELIGDGRLLAEAQQAAGEVLDADPDLSRPEHAPLREKVRRLFSEDGDIFN